MRIDSPPSLDGSKLTLRPLDHSDIDAWYGYLEIPHVVQHTSWNLKSIEDLRPLIDWYNSDDPTSAIRFAIVDNETQVLVGTIGFHTISPVNRSAEIAYDLSPSHWGRGIATQCCRCVVKWGLGEHGYLRIQAAVLDSNAASVRVLQKCGFELEGSLRNYRIVRGEPRNFWLYSCIER